MLPRPLPHQPEWDSSTRDDFARGGAGWAIRQASGCERETAAANVASFLHRAVREKGPGVAQAAAGPCRPTPFHSARAPAVDVRMYIDRLAQHFGCSDSCFVMCVVYIHRLTQARGEVQLCALTVHKLALAGLLVATKLVEDDIRFNTQYAYIGGVPLSELNFIEEELLKGIGWNLYVSQQEFKQYSEMLARASCDEPCEAVSLQPWQKLARALLLAAPVVGGVDLVVAAPSSPATPQCWTAKAACARSDGDSLGGSGASTEAGTTDDSASDAETHLGSGEGSGVESPPSGPSQVAAACDAEPGCSRGGRPPPF